MSIVGDFSVPSESFALEHALSTVPEMTIEADRLATHGPEEVFPFFWATGGDFEAFRQALEEDPTATDVSVAEEMDSEVLYRFEWRQKFLDLIQNMVDHHAAISAASAKDDEWHLRLRFSEEGQVSEFQEYFREKGHQFEVHQLVHPRKPRQQEYGLTKEQHTALIAATRSGYFKVPRATSAEEIGEELGISANAVSQRLRRGTDTMLRSALTIDSYTAED